MEKIRQNPFNARPSLKKPIHHLIYGTKQNIKKLRNRQTIFEVALTVFRYLVDDLRVSYSSVIVFGRSLGSGPAIFLAAQYPWLELGNPGTKPWEQIGHPHKP